MTDNLKQAWKIIREVQDKPELEDGKVDRLVRHTSLAWEEHPHSAMETLMGIAEVFHLRNTKRMVKNIVEHWMTYPNYHWRAGGNADHCFLLGLLASGNANLAAKDHLEKCFPEYWVKDDFYHQRVTEYAAKRELVLQAHGDSIADKKCDIDELKSLNNSASKDNKPKTVLITLSIGESIQTMETYQKYSRLAYGEVESDESKPNFGGYVTLAEMNLEKERGNKSPGYSSKSVRFRNATTLHLEYAGAEDSLVSLIESGVITINEVKVGKR